MGILNKVRPASFFFFLAIPFLLLVFFHIPVSAESKFPEMTLEEAARFLGTSNRDMEYLLNMGQISAHKVRGQWRISRDSVERFLKKLKSKNRKLSNPNEPMSERQLKQTLGGELDRPLPDIELQGGESESTASESKLKKEEEEEKLLIEYLSLRGQGVLLKQGQIIIENSFSFTLNESNRRFIGDIGAGNELVDQTTEDRILRYDFILRYGLLDELQFSADIPYLYREREIDSLGATSLLATSQDLSNEGLGDIGLGLRYLALKESKHGFDLILLAEGFIPADSEPETIFVSQDPLISLGQFGFSGGVTLIKPVDPAVLFLTVAGNHFFSKNVSNQGNLNAFTTLSYASGFSIALNDDFAPFISVSGTHTLKDREIVPLAANPSVQEFNIINLRVGFDYRLSKSLYVEPSVIFGLSEDASDVFFNLSIPYQF